MTRRVDPMELRLREVLGGLMSPPVERLTLHQRQVLADAARHAFPPLPLDERQLMAAAGDRCVNAGGPENMMTPPLPIEDGPVARLMDEFIRDGWMLPEHRDLEIARAYRAQARSALQRLDVFFECFRSAQYAESWVERWLDWQETGA